MITLRDVSICIVITFTSSESFLRVENDRFDSLKLATMGHSGHCNASQPWFPRLWRLALVSQPVGIASTILVALVLSYGSSSWG